jgi:hypothetical protein
MTLTIGALLALSFLISVLGLFMFIWAQMNGLMRAGPDASEVIFAKGEVGLVEDPSLSQMARAALQQVESESSGRTDDAAAQRAAVSEDRSWDTARRWIPLPGAFRDRRDNRLVSACCVLRNVCQRMGGTFGHPAFVYLS